MSMLKLKELAELKDGWNGIRSKMPSGQALTTARNMTPVPLDDGSIQIEMHAGGIDFEMIIARDGRVTSIWWGGT